MKDFITWIEELWSGILKSMNDESPITPIPAAAPVAPAVTPSPDSPFVDPKLIQAIIMVESGGNDNAEGDLHLTDHAYGCMQIRQGVVDDVNKFLGTSYVSQNCLGNRTLSITIFTTYWKIHTALVTNEDRAKAWNGGPGWKEFYGKPNYEKYSENIDSYWAKVQKYL